MVTYASPHEIYAGHSGTGTDFLSAVVLPSYCYSVSVLYSSSS